MEAWDGVGALYYRKFRVGERILLTGHSHQAWPDVALDGQMQAFMDAADHVDEKWSRVFSKAQTVKKAYQACMGDVSGNIALSASTHDLLVKWLSALDMRKRPKIVTTTGEFHTIRRQLDRLEEEGIEVVRVCAQEVSTLAERIAACVDSTTCAVMVSRVLFQNARVVPHIQCVAQACEREGALLCVDAYHALNVIPCDLEKEGLHNAYVTGGGYKYCQFGEGNAFLRIPAHCDLRPVVTGWFAELFSTLQGGQPSSGVLYPASGARFEGATYDPTSQYRAASVAEFFQKNQWTPHVLRQKSLQQMDVLRNCFDALDMPSSVISRDRSVKREEVAGFLALRTPYANAVRIKLLERGVYVDCRGDVLRMGPAPYVLDSQLEEGMFHLAEVCKTWSAA
jgi:kynureninase